MIPAKNVRNLMLHKDVVQAVQEGKFHIWPVSTIEEGIELLTGMPAGTLQGDGTYPEGTLFRRVDDRLRQILEIVKEYGKEGENGKKGKNEETEGGCPNCGA
jgi:predicted ATP-dependent protease